MKFEWTNKKFVALTSLSVFIGITVFSIIFMIFHIKEKDVNYVVRKKIVKVLLEKDTVREIQEGISDLYKLYDTGYSKEKNIVEVNLNEMKIIENKKIKKHAKKLLKNDESYRLLEFYCGINAKLAFKEYLDEIDKKGTPEQWAELGYKFKHSFDFPTDNYESFKWFLKAAEAGIIGAQEEVGDCYRKGEGVSQNEREATKWYRKVFEKDLETVKNNNKDTVVLCRIGNFYKEGKGVTKDYREAAKWLKKAGEAGDISAWNDLGKMYEEGEFGLEKNYDEARKCYQKMYEDKIWKSLGEICLKSLERKIKFEKEMEELENDRIRREEERKKREEERLAEIERKRVEKEERLKKELEEAERREEERRLKEEQEANEAAERALKELENNKKKSNNKAPKPTTKKVSQTSSTSSYSAPKVTPVRTTTTKKQQQPVKSRNELMKGLGGW